MRNAPSILFALAICALASQARGDLQVEIQSPSAGYTVEDGATVVDVEGIASAIGGVRYLDIMFVMDTSSSLRRSDPSDYRSAGAIGLVRNLSPKSDIKIGVVSFDGKSEIAQPMTSDREAAIEALRLLPRSGSTNLAAGINAALTEFERNGRPDSSRVIMLFTDGMSNERKAYDAAVQSHAHGVTIQSLLLGSNTKGTSILDTVAWATGGSFLRVSDPTQLPQAFLDLRTTGVDSVMLSVNGSDPVAARLADCLLQHPVAQRVERGKTEILELQADGVDAKPVGDRRVDLQCLAGDAPSLFGTHHAQRAHVVQAVGQLDQDDADVAHHGQHHFAEVLRLCLGLALEGDLGELGYPVHQLRHLLTEGLGQLFLGAGRVLYDVVQDGRHYGLVVHMQLGQHAGDGQWMVDVGFAGEAALAFMGLGTEQIGTVYLPDLGGFQVGLQHVAQVADQEARPVIAGGVLLGCHGHSPVIAPCCFVRYRQAGHQSNPS